MRIILSIILYAAGFSALAIGGLIYALITLFIPVEKCQGFVRLLCRAILFGFGQKLIIKGRAPELSQGPYLYILNHASILDAFAMGAAIGEHFSVIAASYHFRIPLWGFLVRRYGGISIERHKKDSAINSWREAEAKLRAGKSIAVFPEGTRSVTGKLQPFKKGPFHTAINTNTALSLLVIRGAHQSQNKTSWLIRPGTVTIEFLPIDRFSTLAVDDLRDLTQEQFQLALSG